MNEQLEVLLHSIRHGHYPAFQSLLRINSQLAHLHNEDGVTALHEAAKSPDTNFLRYLFMFGADINSIDKEGKTPLTVSVMTNSLDNTRLLLDENANPTLATKNDWTPLYIAANRGFTTIVTELLKPEYHPENFINKTSSVGGTALIIASTQGHHEIVRLLIEHGADVNVKSNGHFSALWMAVEKGHKTVIKALLDAQADPSTAFISAVERQPFAINTLWETGNIDLSRVDHRGHNALYYAIQNANIPLVKTFLSMGAKLDTQGDKASVTLSIIARHHYDAVVRFVRFYQDEMMTNDPHNFLTTSDLFDFYGLIATNHPFYPDAQMKLFELWDAINADSEGQRIELLEKKLCCAMNHGKDGELIGKLYNDLCGQPYSNELQNRETVNAIQGPEYWINMARTIRNNTTQTNNNEAIKISAASNTFFAHESSATSTNTAPSTSVFNPG